MTAEDVRTLEECADELMWKGSAGHAVKLWTLALKGTRHAEPGAGAMSRRHVTADEEPRTRFGLYRLCRCPECDGRGKVPHDMAGFPTERKCPECRGEGRIRQCVAECETPEAVGVALVTCAREGEWTNADGDPCAFGLLDREGEKGQKWLVSPWLASARNVTDAARTLARSKKERP